MDKTIRDKPSNNYTGPALYQITVEGNLNSKWVQEMTGMTVSLTEGSHIYTLTGKIEDQGALNGLINSLYNRRLTVVSIIKISS